MNHIFEYIVKNSAANNMNKETAVELIKLLKKQGMGVSGDIAVIGMAAKFPGADNTDEFWDNVKNGTDCIGEFPHNGRREDLEQLVTGKNSGKRVEYEKGAYLPTIDTFDYRFFRLSLNEAKCMNPAQRLFLETAWHSIEDAGYTKEALAESKTGIFVGYSSDFGEDYRKMAESCETELGGLISIGNVKSMIAARLAYALDLHGPSLLVDTACSSSLMAVHLACRSLKEGECSMAVAGGIKINLTPFKSGEENKIGIESSVGKTRTFDESSDGTGFGEGIVSIILKPLKKAEMDGDRIYAVIKGSASNQDGASAGITAPNAIAQKELLLQAWKDAGIPPETISYIEAHGTGTKLGDPIEINGIEMAFEEHTGKKQFCAIGSVKTNMGHLDNAAGIASFLKAVLALKHGEIPPSLHFENPNRKIDFSLSPIYVNDRLRKWEGEGVRRCGVSSFGISGTNCHIILEEYGDKKRGISHEERNDYILALSAVSKEALIRLVKRYIPFITEYNGNLHDLCYSTNTGRNQYGVRFAAVFGKQGELVIKLKEFLEKGSETDEGLYFGVCNTDEEELPIYCPLPAETKAGEICLKYIEGCAINWTEYYKDKSNHRIPLPLYPFERSRCWLSAKVLTEPKKRKDLFIDECLAETLNIEIYRTYYSIDTYWSLKEHLVSGYHVLPGTVYLEMVLELCRDSLEDNMVVLEDVFFLAPLALEQGQIREVHTILETDPLPKSFLVTGKTESGFIRHAAGNIRLEKYPKESRLELTDFMKTSTKHIKIPEGEKREGQIITSDRWDCIRDIYFGETKALVYLELKDKYKKESGQYILHPSLMDCCVNGAIESLGSRLYLPYSYGKIRLYDNMPERVYCLLGRKESENDSETAIFDIILCNTEGKVFAEIEDYVLKAADGPITIDKSITVNDMFYETEWTEDSGEHEGESTSCYCLLIRRKENAGSPLFDKLQQGGNEVIEVVIDSDEESVDALFSIRNEEQEYERILAAVKDKRINKIIHMASVSDYNDITVLNQLEENLKYGIYSLFYLGKALVKQRMDRNLELIVLTDYGVEVTSNERDIKPLNGALIGLAKVIASENLNLSVRCIDFDNMNDGTLLFKEIMRSGTGLTVSYRDNLRYTEVLKPVTIHENDSREYPIREKGVYAITGGTGGIGLEIASYLLKDQELTLCLINRTGEMEPESWDMLERKLQKKKSDLPIKIYKADVGDEAPLQAALDSIRKEFGCINGIIHAAGLPDEGFIMNKSAEDFKRVISPKLNGTWLLHHLTEEDSLDFLMVFSSFAGLAGIPGQSAYAAGNSYLDSFTPYGHKRSRNIINIRWPVWKETGMAVKYENGNVNSMFEPIHTRDALTAFRAVLSLSRKNVIIGRPSVYALDFLENVKLSFRLSEDLRHRINRKTEKSRTNTSKGDSVNYFLSLKECSTREITRTEEIIANCWLKVFGPQEISIYDKFYNIGGNSIMASYLLKEIENQFPGIISISDIFTYATIYDMAEYIDGKQNGSKEAEEIDDIMEQLSSGELSVEKAVSMLWMDGDE